MSKYADRWLDELFAHFFPQPKVLRTVLEERDQFLARRYGGETLRHYAAHGRDSAAAEREALIATRLAAGGEYTINQIAQEAGCTPRRVRQIRGRIGGGGSTRA